MKREAVAFIICVSIPIEKMAALMRATESLRIRLIFQHHPCCSLPHDKLRHKKYRQTHKLACWHHVSHTEIFRTKITPKYSVSLINQNWYIFSLNYHDTYSPIWPTLETGGQMGEYMACSNRLVLAKTMPLHWYQVWLTSPWKMDGVVVVLLR